MAILLALLAELCAAISTVVQQQQASVVRVRRAFDPKLLIDLVRQPLWLVGVAVMLAGYGFQAAALGVGDLVLVEPLLGTGVALAVPLAALWRGRMPTRTEMLAAVAVGGGVAAFLAVGHPSGGKSVAGVGGWLPWLAGVLALGFLTAGFSPRLRSTQRGIALAALAGCSFGITDGLTKSIIHLAGEHPGALLTAWELWALAGFGLLGFLAQQSAFHAAPLSVSLPASALLEPVVGTFIGLTVLGEHLRGNAPALTGQLLAVAVAAFGVIVLSRSSIVTDHYRKLPTEVDT